MSTGILSQHKILDDAYSSDSSSKKIGRGDVSTRLATLEAELQCLREEFDALREAFLEREEKGAKLNEAYKTVLADISRMIEAQRDESLKRDESQRFFLSSIETRLKGELREELGLDPVEDYVAPKSWWPFGKNR